MAARVIARGRLAFNWEVVEYDRPKFGHYIWYTNITNNRAQSNFPHAEIESQLQQFDERIQLAVNDDVTEHDSIIWDDQGFTRPFPSCFGIPTDDADGDCEYYNYHCHLPGRDYISNMFTSCVVVL